MSFVLVGNDFPAAQTLDLLLRSGRSNVAMVFTDIASPSSGMLRHRSEKAGIPFYPSSDLKSEHGVSRLRSAQSDWLININSTVLLSAEVLKTFRCGALNMHPGLLPEYGGLHAHQWALMNDEREFGATVHHITPRVDAGDIVAEKRVPVEETDTGLSLFLKCIRAGTEAMESALSQIVSGKVPAGRRQDLSRRRVYRLRDAPDGRIDWTWPADFIERFVRAGNYEPLTSPTFTAWLVAPGGEELEALKVAVKTEPATAPGSVMAGDRGAAPLVACGDGSAVRLLRIRRKSDHALLSAAELRELIPAGSRLI